MEENIKIELVPNGCMGISLKNGLDKSVWNQLRMIALKKCENKCACCGKDLKGFEAHEVWEYDKKTATRKLVDIIAVCSNCHKAIHMNRSYLCENLEKIDVNLYELDSPPKDLKWCGTNNKIAFLLTMGNGLYKTDVLSIHKEQT